MADNPNAQLTFRSWLRRGLATQQKLVNANDPRASVEIDVAISGIATPPSVTLALHGPGDVKSLIVRSVIRTWPKAGARNAEANYFPLIEFDQADSAMAVQSTDHRFEQYQAVAMRGCDPDGSSKGFQSEPRTTAGGAECECVAAARLE